MGFVCWTILHTSLLAIGILLLYVGSSTHSKDLCSGEPWLPISMIVAGAFLICATAITALACGFRSNQHQQGSGGKYPGKGSLWTIVWFFCCGLGTVIGSIAWLGIWITSTYLTITTIQKLQVKHQDTFECSLTTVLASGVSVMIVWLISLGMCFYLALVLHKNRTQIRSQPAPRNLNVHNMYNPVPQVDNHQIRYF